MLTPKLAIVIPAYNEEEVLPLTIDKLTLIFEEFIEKNVISDKSYILFVNDGSTDKTWQIIQNAHNERNYIYGIKFSKNFGNQSAILAGYSMARKISCDAVITIDADLQQDPYRIEEFVQSYLEGYDIVCGIRNSYENKFSLKSLTSKAFYKTMNILGCPLKANHSEYRLLSKKALDILNEYTETNAFVRGMIQDLGLKTKYIYYDISKRLLGQSKFNLVSLTGLALKGIVSYSTRPLKFVFLIGAAISTLSLLFAVGFVIGLIFDIKIITNDIGPFRIWQTFMDGMQILCLGLIGEYIGQVLLETKARPRYIIDEKIIS